MNIPTTINDFISMKSDFTISQDKLSIPCYIHDKMTDETIQVPISNIINKYKDYFDKITCTVIVDDEQMNTYKYKPKMLSYDLYGTTELWSILLYINDCKSVMDFNKTRLKLLYPDKIEDLLNEIFILET